MADHWTYTHHGKLWCRVAQRFMLCKLWRHKFYTEGKGGWWRPNAHK